MRKLKVGKQIGVWVLRRIRDDELVAFCLVVRLVECRVIVILDFGDDWGSDLAVSECLPIDTLEEAVALNIFDAILEVAQASRSVCRQEHREGVSE